MLSDIDRMFDHGSNWFQGAFWGAPDEPSLQALRALLPWEWATSVAEARPWHPVFLQMWMRPSAEELKQVGAFLASRRTNLRGIRSRLRDPSGYSKCIAELRAGMLFEKLGATLVHEPFGAGADWLACWRDGSITFEAKQPQRSARSEAHSMAVSDLMLELQRHAVPATEAAWLTLYADPLITRPCIPHTGLTPDQIRAHAGTLAHAVPFPTRPWTKHFPGIGTLEIKLGAPGPVRFNFSAYMSISAREHELRKLSSMLETAANQLRRSSYPGVIAVDLSQDAQVGNYEPELFHMLVTADWARPVSGILLIGALDNDLSPRNRLLVRPGEERRLDPLIRSLSDL